MKLLFYRLYCELNANIQSIYSYLNAIMYYVIILVLFAVSSHNINLTMLVGTDIILATSFIVSIFSLDTLFFYEKSSGLLIEYKFIKRVSLFSVIIIKFLGKCIFLTLITVINILFSFLLLNINFTLYVGLTVTIIASLPAILLIGILSATILIGYAEKIFLLSAIVFPLYIPILIFTNNILITIQGNNVISFETILPILIITLFFSAVTPILSTYILKTWN